MKKFILTSNLTFVRQKDKKEGLGDNEEKNKIWIN